MKIVAASVFVSHVCDARPERWECASRCDILRFGARGEKKSSERMDGGLIFMYRYTLDSLAAIRGRRNVL